MIIPVEVRVSAIRKKKLNNCAIAIDLTAFHFCALQNKCIHCNKIFCCPQCRVKHEIKMHTFKTVTNNADGTCTWTSHFQSCPLCAGEKLLLQRIQSDQLLEHISVTHLPLQCNKCSKVTGF